MEWRLWGAPNVLPKKRAGIRVGPNKTEGCCVRASNPNVLFLFLFLPFLSFSSEGEQVGPCVDVAGWVTETVKVGHQNPFYDRGAGQGV